MSILKPGMPVAICCDHAGFDTKQAVIEYFKQNGIEYKDFGTLNKHQGIRSALCWIPEIAKLTRQHNDANVLVMPGRFVSNEEALEILKAFMETEFEGGRHCRRIDKIPVK